MSLFYVLFHKFSVEIAANGVIDKVWRLFVVRTLGAVLEHHIVVPAALDCETRWTLRLQQRICLQ
jgi:hypothetical protein